jgi:hypothetical protein
LGGQRVGWAGLGCLGGDTKVTARSHLGLTEMATVNAPSSSGRGGGFPFPVGGGGGFVESQIPPQSWEVGTVNLARTHSVSK